MRWKIEMQREGLATINNDRRIPVTLAHCHSYHNFLSEIVCDIVQLLRQTLNIVTRLIAEDGRRVHFDLLGQLTGRYYALFPVIVLCFVLPKIVCLLMKRWMILRIGHLTHVRFIVTMIIFLIGHGIVRIHRIDR